jgi:hypothetical protein
MTFDQKDGSIGPLDTGAQGSVDSITMSRRALLKKAGWVVPTLVLLPMNTAYGQTGGFPSPGPVELADGSAANPLSTGGSPSGSPSTQGNRRAWGLTRGGGRSQENNTKNQ